MNLKVEYGLDGLNRVILTGPNTAGMNVRMVLAKGLSNSACEQYVSELKTILQCESSYVQIVENENE